MTPEPDSLEVELHIRDRALEHAISTGAVGDDILLMAKHFLEFLRTGTYEKANSPHAG